jgi:HK97 family phage major capsid protein
MSKITDPNKLAELQNKRLELANKMQSYHTEHEKTWSDENETVWKQINDDYDAVNGPLDAHQKAVAAEARSEEAANIRASRLATIAEHGTRFSNAAQNSIKGMGGDQNSGKNFQPGSMTDGKVSGGMLNGESIGRVGMMAFSAWATGRMTPKAAEACRILNFNPNAREVDFNLLDTGEYLPIQNAVRDGKVADFRNSLSSNVGTSGGYTFGPTFVTSLEMAMTSASGIMEVADIIRTDHGEEMRWPTADDTANEGSQVGESAAVDDEVEPTFGQKKWYAHKFKSGMIKVPYELLEDNAVGLENRIPQMLGERIGRIINRKGTLGDGASTFYGIVPASTSGKTAAGAAAIVFDELIDLEHSVNRAIRADRTMNGYMFNDTTLKLIRKLKDGQSRYLWQSGANTGAPDTMNTYRYTINDHMQDPASGVKSVLFGRLSSYKVRIVKTVRFRRLDERYADNDEVAFIAFLRADGNLLNAGDNPVKALVHP